MKKTIAALLFCGITLALSAEGQSQQTSGSSSAQTGKPRLGIGWFTALENTASADADTIKSLVERQIVSSKKFTVIFGEDFSRLGVRGYGSESLAILKQEHIDYMLIGSVKALTTGKELGIWILDNDGNEIASGARFTGNSAQEIYGTVTALLNEALAGMIRSGRLEYAVGDRGPAGGWIFYDKGYSSDGWRYLECAPKAAEFNYSLDTAINYDALRDTSTDIGEGKSNTQKLTEYARRNPNSRSQVVMAAKRCAELNFGGYSDWFMPSISELSLIGKANIKEKAELNGVYHDSAQNGLFHIGTPPLYDKVRPVRQF
jgi:hypothetical protein